MVSNLGTEFQDFVTTTPRWERYRLARKTFKFRVYRFMENYVLISFVLLLLAPGLGEGIVKTVIAANLFVVPVIGLAHYGEIVSEQPWLALAAAFEAAVLWVLFAWLVKPYFDFPYFWGLCIFVFVYRFWMRGEREVNIRAFRVLKPT